MVLTTQHLEAGDRHQIPLYLWNIEHPKATVLIAHGMAEHSRRYARIAEQLNRAGYNVAAIDHRGHGENSHSSHQKQGQFAEEQGWDRVLDDIGTAFDFLQAIHDSSRVFVFGHSMGSFIVQAWLIRDRIKPSGVVLSGSTYNCRPMLHIGRFITWLESCRIGRSGTSRLVSLLTFGSYNNGFKPTRTPCDWLSRDADEVDAYIADPDCGFPCTNSLWLDLFQGLLSITSVPALKKINAGLPIYIMGGSRDPVGRNGRGLQQLANKLASAGINDIELDIWPDGRHEMLNETNRDEVTARLIGWLDKRSS